MRYVAAYLLAQLGGNDAPDTDAIKSILSRFLSNLWKIFQRNFKDRKFKFTIFYVPFAMLSRQANGSRVSESIVTILFDFYLIKY